MTRETLTAWATIVAVFGASGALAQSEPTVVACSFERLPLMLLTFRGGMSADDNTVQIGDAAPIR